MPKSLVSIITPLFNSEKFIERYFQSILHQTYHNIELILINDGSTDLTDSMVKLYWEQLQAKVTSLRYITQLNSGLGATINRGLEIFTGDFLTWPDADDIMHPDYLEKKVDYFIQHDDCDLLISKVNVVDETNINSAQKVLERKHNDSLDDFFCDLIYWNNIIPVPGAYMVRSSAFLSVVGRHIYPDKNGQNFQILLPMAYQQRYSYLDEILFTYVIREDSLSYSFRKSIDNKIEHTNIYENIIVHTLMDMKMDVNMQQKYIKLVRRLYQMERNKLSAQL